MKIKFIILVAIIIALIMVFNNTSSNEEIISFNPLELELGQEFTALKNDKSKYVLNYSILDVTGDSKNDVVIVVAENSSDEKYKNFDVYVYDTSNETLTKVISKKCESKVNKIEIKDLTGDGIGDVFFILENDDKTLNISVATYSQGKFEEIFTNSNNDGVNVIGVFLDGFKAEINFKNYNKKNTYDLQENKQSYVTSGFYAENGKLLSKNTAIKASKFTNIEFVMLSDSYGIKTKQLVKGFDNLDVLDELQILWKYEDGRWITCEAVSTKFGNLLY